MFDPTDHPIVARNPLTGNWCFGFAASRQAPVAGCQQETLTVRPGRYNDPECYLCTGNKRVTGEQNPAYTDTFVFTNDSLQH